MKYFSPSTGFFYDTAFHGTRTIMVADPNWTAPEDHPDAQVPLVEVSNPDCKLPGDVVAVSDERHAQLFAGQAEGKIIVAGGGGNPVLADPPPPTAEEAWANLRSDRDRRLTATDWTQASDVSDEVKEKYRAYRQALRDLPDNTPDPLEVTWPVKPT